MHQKTVVCRTGIRAEFTERTRHCGLRLRTLLLVLLVSLRRLGPEGYEPACGNPKGRKLKLEKATFRSRRPSVATA